MLSCIDVIKDVYEEVVLNVNSLCGILREFLLHLDYSQGSGLESQLFFTLIMDEPTRKPEDKVCWLKLFTNDLVLVNETR